MFVAIKLVSSRLALSLTRRRTARTCRRPGNCGIAS
uniref:Uncharacterized protein n=1 Tax=Anguilla anguilla TaxID=7936 RepID=A0A0E9RLE0_ANGAN